MYKLLSAVALSLIAGTTFAAEYSATDLSHEYLKDAQTFNENHQEESDFVIHGTFKRLDTNIDGQVMQIHGLPAEELSDEYDPRGAIQLNPVNPEDKQLQAFKEGDSVTAHCQGMEAISGVIMFQQCTFASEK